MTKRKVILDVDTGIDDALGILLAVKSEQLDIVGITVTSGNVSLEQATINTCKVLQMIVRTDIPVVKGAKKPLLRKAAYEHHVHGQDGLGGALAYESVQMPVKEGFAADYIIEQVTKHPGEITLVMTAPLTNLALALQKSPEIAGKIKEVISMGGVVCGPGNVTPVSEFNIYADPEAAKIVYHSGVKLILVGLDVTHKTLLRKEHIHALKQSKAGAFVEQSTKIYRDFFELQHGIHACALHDPLAVGVAIDPSLVETKHLYVDVETKSELCDGQTVCDFKNKYSKPANVHVCLEVDSERFLRIFIDYLKR